MQVFLAAADVIVVVDVITTWSSCHNHCGLYLLVASIFHYLIMHVFLIETEDDYQGCLGKSSLADNSSGKELVPSDRRSHKRKSWGYDHTPCGAGALKKPRLNVDNMATPTLDNIPGGRDKTKRDEDEVVAVRSVAGITCPVPGKSVEQNGQGSDLDLFTSPDGSSSKKTKRKRHRTYSIPSKEEEENVAPSSRGGTIVDGCGVAPPARGIDACVEEVAASSALATCTTDTSKNSYTYLCVYKKKIKLIIP